MENENKTRRNFLHFTILATAGLALAPAAVQAQNLTGGSLTADLMHDHGLVRHALAIYQHVAFRLQQERLDTREQAVLSKALNETARIFHEHAENYHAKAIEETHMFPMLMKMPQPISRYPGLLTAQHERGAEMTAYLIDVTRDGKLPMDRAKQLSRALLAFKQMYEHHSMHEDTFVYLAWQNALSPAGRNEMQQAFAEIEQRMLGQNAYDEAFNRLVAIESNLGIADLGQYTMPDIRTY
jgi:hemerythrin-like domain-containing protein